jgi:hypothetical protein
MLSDETETKRAESFTERDNAPVSSSISVGQISFHDIDDC